MTLDWIWSKMGTSPKLKGLNMSDKIDFNAAKAYVKTKASNFLDRSWSGVILFAGAALATAYVVSGIMNHATEVKTVSLQNATCVYLESSDLGSGQHYMICNGNIVIVRAKQEEIADPEETLEEVLPVVENTTSPET